MSASKRRVKANKATVTIAQLAAAFPKCFAVYERRRRPLKIGIRQDILARLPAMDTGELSDALRRYCRNLTYLRILQAGAGRIDLDGKPAGSVTADAREHAGIEIKERSTRVRVDKTARGDKAGPKRLGLTDLKQAARQRASMKRPGTDLRATVAGPKSKNGLTDVKYTRPPPRASGA